MNRAIIAVKNAVQSTFKLLLGVTGRFLVVFLAMGAMTGAAVYVGNKVFNDIAEETQPLTETHLPALDRVANLEQQGGKLRDELAEILLVPANPSAKRILKQHQDEVRETIKVTQGLIEEMDQQTRDELKPMLANAEAALNALISARIKETVDQLDIQTAQKQMNAQGAEVSAMLDQMTNTARTELVKAGKETIKKVDARLSALIDKDMNVFARFLTLKADIGFLSGTTLALAGAQDPKLIQKLYTLATDARTRVSEGLPDLADNAEQTELVAGIEAGLDTFDRALFQIGRITPELKQAILEQQTQLDGTLQSAVVQAMKTLEAHANKASSENRSAINLLIEWQLVELIELNQLDVALKSFFITGLQGAAAPDLKQARTLRDQLAMQLLDLQLKASDKDLDLAQKIEALTPIADPDTGIVAKRISLLEARNTVAENSAQATSHVLAISDEAAKLGEGAMTKISDAATLLNSSVSAARQRMQVIGIASISLFVIALALTYMSMVRPLRRAAEATVRLAAGDLTELTGLSRQRSELGDLSRALSVFRTNLIEKEQMERDQAELEARQRQAEEDARKEEEAREARERAREEKAREEQRQREEEERARREEIRAAAEREREILTQQQDQVVDALADGLRKLAAGDLQVRLDHPFADRYEPLREDFNVAIDTLAGMLRVISRSAQSIDGNSGEIRDAAMDLSHRTEASALALRKSSSTLSQLTASVQSAAQGAKQVDSLVGSTRKTAEQSGKVVQEAVTAMNLIEESSKQISKITSVIDDISFQTNLLALNAGVEAARAGETGRGFAVVAAEVRALAQRSSDAAQEISKLISSSSEQVEHGVSLVDKAGQEISRFISEVEEITEHVSKIANSAQEQSVGLTEISTAISQLDSVTQENTAMFEETSAACQSLAQEAMRLTDAVHTFRLQDAHDPYDAAESETEVEQWSEAG